MAAQKLSSFSTTAPIFRQIGGGKSPFAPKQGQFSDFGTDFAYQQ
jgi:hypothetical protein